MAGYREAHSNTITEINRILYIKTRTTLCAHLWKCHVFGCLMESEAVRMLQLLPPSALFGKSMTCPELKLLKGIHMTHLIAFVWFVYESFIKRYSHNPLTA